MLCSRHLIHSLHGDVGNVCGAQSDSDPTRTDARTWPKQDKVSQLKSCLFDQLHIPETCSVDSHIQLVACKVTHLWPAADVCGCSLAVAKQLGQGHV